MMNRRRLLGWIGATAGAAMIPPALAGDVGGRRVERIGLQLYTVRELLADDVPGTLAAVAAAGYTEVETAGYADLEPGAFAAALQQAGLTAPSAHVPLKRIESAPSQLLEEAAMLGHRYLVLPFLMPWQRLSLDAYRDVADTLNAFGEQCAAAGIRLAYHNHDFEFEPIDGQRPYDLLLERCDPARVCFELDLYWASKAGADPAGLLRAAPQRFRLCHVKDMDAEGEMTEVGKGTIDFAALFAAGVELEHYFVEHDKPGDPLASIRHSIAAMRTLRY
jgi:sugar phosphate isomerase/epimerase